MKKLLLTAYCLLLTAPVIAEQILCNFESKETQIIKFNECLYARANPFCNKKEKMYEWRVLSGYNPNFLACKPKQFFGFCVPEGEK